LFDINDDKIDQLPSPVSYFRNRSRFAVLYSTNDAISSSSSSSSSSSASYLDYAMWEGGSASVVVKEFPIACTLTNLTMQACKQLIDTTSELGSCIQAIHFLSTTTHEDIVITFIYEKQISSEIWMSDAEILRKNLSDHLNLLPQNVTFNFQPSFFLLYLLFIV
jgi:hypothetical protein